jgi:GNAT superfamily N-acetyltransferase
LALYPHLHTAEAPLTPAQAAPLWAEALANPRIRYFGADADGDLVASCNLVIVPNLTRAGRPYGVIENVVTHPDHRGQGCARAVLAAALAHAWGEGCYKVVLTTSRLDAGTAAFYEKCGFDGADKRAFVARCPSA